MAGAGGGADIAEKSRRLRMIGITSHTDICREPGEYRIVSKKDARVAAFVTVTSPLLLEIDAARVVRSQA